MLLLVGIQCSFLVCLMAQAHLSRLPGVSADVAHGQVFEETGCEWQECQSYRVPAIPVGMFGIVQVTAGDLA